MHTKTSQNSADGQKAARNRSGKSPNKGKSKNE